MAAAAGCHRPSSTCSDYSALTSEDPVDGGSLTATSAAGGQSSSIAVGSVFHYYAPTARSVDCLGNDERDGGDGQHAGTGGTTAATSHFRAVAAAGATTAVAIYLWV